MHMQGFMLHVSAQLKQHSALMDGGRVSEMILLLHVLKNKVAHCIFMSVSAS